MLKTIFSKGFISSNFLLRWIILGNQQSGGGILDNSLSYRLNFVDSTKSKFKSQCLPHMGPVTLNVGASWMTSSLE